MIVKPRNLANADHLTRLIERYTFEEIGAESAGVCFPFDFEETRAVSVEKFGGVSTPVTVPTFHGARVLKVKNREEIEEKGR